MTYKSVSNHINEIGITKDDIPICGRSNTSTGFNEILDFLNISSVNIILEIGTELGTSTRMMADVFPTSKIYCIDSWVDNYPIHPDWTDILPYLSPNGSLFPVFLKYMESYGDRIFPVIGFSDKMIKEVFNAGIVPYLVYVDGDHRYEGVMEDLNAIHSYYPESIVFGDDWNFTSSHVKYKGREFPVREAVIDFANNHGYQIMSIQNTWTLIKNKINYGTHKDNS